MSSQDTRALEAWPPVARQVLSLAGTPQQNAFTTEECVQAHKTSRVALRLLGQTPRLELPYLITDEKVPCISIGTRAQLYGGE